MIQTLPFLITYESNYLINCQDMIGFYIDSRYKDTIFAIQYFLRGMLVKADFTSKLSKTRTRSNSLTFLSNENKSFIVYS